MAFEISDVVKQHHAVTIANVIRPGKFDDQDLVSFFLWLDMAIRDLGSRKQCAEQIQTIVTGNCRYGELMNQRLCSSSSWSLPPPASQAKHDVPTEVWNIFNRACGMGFSDDQLFEFFDAILQLIGSSTGESPILGVLSDDLAMEIAEIRQQKEIEQLAVLDKT